MVYVSDVCDVCGCGYMVYGLCTGREGERRERERGREGERERGGEGEGERGGDGKGERGGDLL